MKDFPSEAVNELRHNARSVVRELGLLNDAYFGIGVTLAERHLLIELSVYRSPTMGDIARRLLLDKSTVSRLISKAAKKGYIKCTTGDKDKRKRFLQLTKKGRHVLNAFEPIAFSQTKDALLTLTTEQARTVYQGVALYAKGLQAARLQDKQNSPCPEKDTGQAIESLPEISKRLNQLGYVLELFHPKDETGLYNIFQEVYECSSIQEFHQQFFSPQGQTYVCRSKEGTVIGGFFIRPNFSGKASHIANAAYMIQDAYRGKGIGSLLVKASLHLAKNLKFQAMQFNLVLSHNTVAIKLYEKLGFNIIGTVPEAVRNPDGSYQDGYIMHRKL
jgi:DNA-binding MarR family transcriptional regulator/RimJ/RimL family protein N-acetyltransferase